MMIQNQCDKDSGCGEPNSAESTNCSPHIDSPNLNATQAVNLMNSAEFDNVTHDQLNNYNNSVIQGDDFETIKRPNSASNGMFHFKCCIYFFIFLFCFVKIRM